MLTQERLKEVLDYDQHTGTFTWKVAQRRKNKKGTVGSDHNVGYLQIRVDYKGYLSHRLAWLYCYGYFPHEIDHVNGNKKDNRIENLREVSHTCNLRNCKLSKNNKTGVTGVRIVRNYKKIKYRTEITLHGTVMLIGEFYDFDEAVAHRLAVEQCLDWYRCGSETSAHTHIKNMCMEKSKNE